MVKRHYIHRHVYIGSSAGLLFCALLMGVGTSRDAIGENYG